MPVHPWQEHEEYGPKKSARQKFTEQGLQAAIPPPSLPSVPSAAGPADVALAPGQAVSPAAAAAPPGSPPPGSESPRTMALLQPRPLSRAFIRPKNPFACAPEDLNCDNLNLDEDVREVYRMEYGEILNIEEEETMQHEGDTIPWIYESPHPRRRGSHSVASRSRSQPRADNQMHGGGGRRSRAASRISVHHGDPAGFYVLVLNVPQQAPATQTHQLANGVAREAVPNGRDKQTLSAVNGRRVTTGTPRVNGFGHLGPYPVPRRPVPASRHGSPGPWCTLSRMRGTSASRAASHSIASTTRTLTGSEHGAGVLQSPGRAASEVRGRSASRGASRSIASATPSRTLTEPGDGDGVLQSPRRHSVDAASRSPSAPRATSRSIDSATRTPTGPRDVLQSPRRHSVDAASQSPSQSRADNQMRGRSKATSEVRGRSAPRATSPSIASATQTRTGPRDGVLQSPRRHSGDALAGSRTGSPSQSRDTQMRIMRGRSKATSDVRGRSASRAAGQVRDRNRSQAGQSRRSYSQSPLPPSSPHDVESDTDHSSDEYGKSIDPGEQRKQEREERLMLRQDRADYREYLEEAAQTGFRDDSDSGSRTEPRGRGRARARIPGKGKGKARDGEYDSFDNADTAKHKRGPLSAEFQERAMAAQEIYYDSIEEIAKAAGKPATAIHQFLGTTPKFARESQPWNSRVEYEKALSHLSDEQRKDSRYIWKALPWLLQWDGKKNANAIAAWRENGEFKRQVILAVKPLTQMCRLLNENYGVHVFGYAIDMEGEASFIFGGSDAFSKISAEQKVTLSRNVKDLEALFRTQDMQRRGLNIETTVLPRLFPNSIMETDEREDRDFLRTKFGKMMRRQLGLESEGKSAETTMAWNERFLYLAWKGKFRLINYPSALQNIGQIIGGNYNPKKPNVPEFQAFMPAFEKASSENPEQYDDDIDTSTALAIVPWTDAEKQLPLQEQRDVPLVISASWSDDKEEGEILRYVKDCKEYHEEVVKAAKQRIQQRRPAQRQRQHQKSPDEIRRRQVSPTLGPTNHLPPYPRRSVGLTGTFTPADYPCRRQVYRITITWTVNAQGKLPPPPIASKHANSITGIVA
ncbi:hypothetical protein GGX14DRAFT_398378 [Mycena pura]|uniref:Uncharacterized protein n=1 Tax=Mycena pura TaxID=153505 RepID=A0AAD6VAI2_9AGAR|nr:hypothetical protein GGX14DRAFT_398378 [Mycena pura]